MGITRNWAKRYMGITGFEDGLESNPAVPDGYIFTVDDELRNIYYCAYDRGTNVRDYRIKERWLDMMEQYGKERLTDIATEIGYNGSYKALPDVIDADYD